MNNTIAARVSNLKFMVVLMYKQRKTNALPWIYSNHPFIAFLIKNNMEDKQLRWTGWEKLGDSKDMSVIVASMDAETERH